MKCRRTACDATHNIIFRHTQTGDLYCPACARAINEFTPGLVAWPPTDLMAQYRDVREWHADADGAFRGRRADGSVIVLRETANT